MAKLKVNGTEKHNLPSEVYHGKGNKRKNCESTIHSTPLPFFSAGCQQRRKEGEGSIVGSHRNSVLYLICESLSGLLCRDGPAFTQGKKSHSLAQLPPNASLPPSACDGG